MVILAVDDEKLALEGLTRAIAGAEPEAEIHAFQNGENALTFAEQSPCDVMFLDIQLRGSNGIEIAGRLKTICPRSNIVFTTGYSEYRGEAFNLHASGYIIKPVTAEKIRAELSDLRYPLARVPAERLVIRAFGNFEVYCDGEPVQFHYSKTKELLAYLVDRCGALCSNRQLISTLWEESGTEAKSSYFSNLRNDLISTFRRLGCDNVLIRQPGKLGIRTGTFYCDYYDWLKGKAVGFNAFRGEYMSQYSWGEDTLGRLEIERLKEF